MENKPAIITIWHFLIYIGLIGVIPVAVMWLVPLCVLWLTQESVLVLMGALCGLAIGFGLSFKLGELFYKWYPRYDK